MTDQRGGHPSATEGRPPRAASWPIALVAVPLVGLAVLSPPTLMVAVVGLLPAIVACTVDRSPERAATFGIGGLNLAGVVPYLLPVWAAPDGIGAAVDILTDAAALAVMYGAAAFGWLLLFAVPAAVVAIETAVGDRRVTVLKAERQRLIEQWGETVARPPQRSNRGA